MRRPEQRPSRLSKYQKCCAEVDKQFHEIHQNLSANMKIVEDKARQIRQINLDHKQSYREIADREAQLNVYAEIIVEKSESLRMNKDRMKKHFHEVRGHIESETEEKLRQLELLTERGRLLTEQQSEFSTLLDKLSHTIQDKENAIKNLVDRYSFSVSSIDEMTEVDYDTSIFEKKASIQSLRLKIPEIAKEAADAKDRIYELETQKTKLRISRQTSDKDMSRAMETIKSLRSKFKKHKLETQSKIREEKRKEKTFKQDQEEISNTSRTCRKRQENNQTQMKSDDKTLATVEAQLAKEREKIAFNDEILTRTNEQMKKLKSDLEKSKRAAEEKEKTAVQYEARFQELSTELENLKSQQANVKAAFETEKERMKESADKVVELEMSAKVAIETYEQIEVLKQDEAELTATLENLARPIEIQPNSDMLKTQEMMEQRISACQKELKAAEKELKTIREQVFGIESQIQSSKSQLSDIRDALTGTSQNASGLWNRHEELNIANVTDFVKSKAKKREKRRKAKERNVCILEERLKKAYARMTLLRDHLQQQRKMFRSSSAFFVTGKSDLGVHSMQSFLRALNDEISVWNLIKGEEVAIILSRWDTQLAGLFDEIDDYFLA